MEEKDFVEGPEDTRIEEINTKHGKGQGNYVIDEPDEMVGDEREGNLEFLHKAKIWADISLMVNT